MPRNRLNREGPYRFTPAGLVALILFSVTAGMLIQRQVLAAFDPAARAPLDFGLMAKAGELIEQHYVDRGAIKPRRMTYGAIGGMVDSLGDTGHSIFLTPAMVRAAPAA